MKRKLLLLLMALLPMVTNAKDVKIGSLYYNLNEDEAEVTSSVQNYNSYLDTDVKVLNNTIDAKTDLLSNKWSEARYTVKAITYTGGPYGVYWNEGSPNLINNPNYNKIAGVPEVDDIGRNWYDTSYSCNWPDEIAPLNNWCSYDNYGDIYARRTFYYDGDLPTELYLACGHDDAPCEYYLNGQLIWSETDGWYEQEIYRLTQDQISLLKPGEQNVLAFHVHQNWGGVYADCGLYTSLSNIETPYKCGDNLTWDFDRGTGTLTISGTGDMYDNMLWGGYHSEIRHVIIQPGVTSIGYMAFDNCQRLISISLPESVKTIGGLAFFSCGALTSITIPDNVTIIGENAFAWCFNLSDLTLNENLIEIGQRAFQNTNLKNLVIPNSVQVIGGWAFENYNSNPSLESVVIGKSVINIDDGAFQYQTNLMDVTCLAIDPPSVKNESVFSVYNNLFIPSGRLNAYNTANYWNWFNTIKELPYTLDAKTNLPSNKWSGERYTVQAISYSGGLYGEPTENNSNYNKIVGVPNRDKKGKKWYDTNYICNWDNSTAPLDNWCEYDNMSDIYARRTFYYEGNLPTELYLACGHDDAPCEYYLNGQLIWSETDGWYEQEIYRLTQDQISLLKPGEQNVLAFHVHQNWGGIYADCGLYTSLSNIETPNKCGDNLIWDFDRDTGTLTISGTGDMYDNMLWGGYHSEIKHVIIQPGVTSIGYMAFDNCQKLLSISIPESVKTIGGLALFNCSSLTSITIPDDVIIIGNSAFEGCRNLKSVTIGYNVEVISDAAFYKCQNLLSITVYAMTPPTLGSNVFQGVTEGLIIYVPVAAIDQYQADEGWGKFTLLPIQENVCSIIVSLPEGANVQDYAQMWLELTNTESGQKLHYVITDRRQYTFPSISPNSIWNIVLRNERGDIFGQIDNVEVKNEDVSVMFTSFSKPQGVMLSVLTPEGQDVTSQTQITWTDAQNNYIAQSASLSGLPVGYQANYSVVLSQELAMVYETPLAAEYTLKDDGNNIICQLDSIKQVTLSGKVKDAETGLPLSGTVISASQTFGGKYTKTLTAKTDKDGVFTMEVSNVPTSLTYAATDYITQTVNYDNGFDELIGFVVPDVSLRPITGATITIDFTYTTVEGETQEWYSDYQNVAFELYNVTKDCAISEFNVQYPQIVLLEEVEDGDELRLIASSRTNAFMPVESKATIAEQKAEATFAIKELGRIQAMFTTSGNASVVGSLYDASGKLVKTYNYSNAMLTISGLSDGQYTLVSMGSSQLYNTIYDLAQLSQTGLAEGSDYVKNTVEVKSGAISMISIDEVPTLNESKLYYTGNNTSFTVNKPSIVVGNYIALTGHIDFKPDYASNVSNVNLIVDLPESCEFVENSVIVGNSTNSYTLNGSRITIPMTNYTDRVLLCVIPTLGGNHAPSAFAQFDLNGETIMQPIGSANYTAKDLSISVPSTVAKTSIPVSGTAIGKSEVEIYDNGVLIGQTTSLATGRWVTTCELNEPYNLSTHKIFAKVTTMAGLELQSETVECQYDMNTVEVKTVTMINTAHPSSSLNPREYETVFDLQRKTVSPSSYRYWPAYPDFTFIADLTNNDTTVVKDVTIRVYTDKKNWRNLEASYNNNLDRWVAMRQFNSDELPVGVDVDFIANSECKADRILVSTAIDNIDIKRMDVEAQRNEYTNQLNQQKSDSLRYELDLNQIEILSSQIEILSSKENYDDVEMASLISQYCTLMGFAIDTESIFTEVVDEMDEETTRQFLNRCRELIGGYDGTALIDSVNATINSFDFDILSKDSLDYEAVFDAIEDTLYYEHDGIPMMIYQIRPEMIDWAKYDSTLFEHLPMTEGKDILVYAYDKEAIIIDQERNIAWIASPIDNVHYVSRRIRKINGQDIVESLRDAVINIKTFIQGVFNWVNDKAGLIKKEIAEIEKQLVQLDNDYSRLISQKAANAKRLSEIERQIEIINQGGGGRMFYDELEDMKTQLKIERGKLMAKNMDLSKQIQNAKSQMDKLKNCRMMKLALLGTVLEYLDIAKNLYTLVDYGNEGIRDISKWNNFIESILPCDDDYTKAVAIKNRAEDNRGIVGGRYTAALLISTVQNAFGMYMTFNPAAKSAKWAVKTLAGVVNSFLGEIAKRLMEEGRNLSKQYMSVRMNEKGKLKCKDDKCPNCHKNPCECKEPDPKTEPERDPSGYVYEGVPSNRLQGVTATAYYKEMVEDMYGDLHENIVKWNAEDYAQENPLFTDEYGMYAWDVPQGLWQVKFEKEGYETTYSEWLPVPPPQLDINISMKQSRQPEIKEAHAYEDGVEVEFDKYMMSELLTTENISVIQNGNAVEGTIELLNEETSYESETETFASKVRFNAAQPFTGQEVTLVVANSVKSYADIPMQDTYTRTLDIEKEVKEIVVDSLVKVPYQGAGTISIQVLPADAAAGRTLTIKNSSLMILGVETEQVIIDEDGKAEVTVSGELPGTAALTFSVEETDKTAVTIVNVEQIEPVATPTANFASGSMVEKGTQIFLYCDTEGATIYYTLDGSCPCVNSEARKVYDGTPITIEKNTVIKAMAAAPDMEESEVATFVYIITLGDLNGDGKVDIADGVTVLNTMAEGKYDDFVDVNHDQKVDIADFVTILNIMAANDSFIHQ